MDRNTLPCLQTPRSMYSSIYNSFPVIRTTNYCKKSPFLRNPAFYFCLPRGRPGDNHAKRCMNEKTIQCLANPSHYVPIYLQQFPSYLNRKCKKLAVFTYRSPHFISPGDALRLSPNMFHGWKDNSMLAKPLAACTYLSSIVSELYDA